MSDMSNWAQFFQAYNDYNERCADLLEGRYTYLLGTTPFRSDPVFDREGSAILLDKSLVGYDFNNLQLWVRQLDKDLTSSIDNIDKVNKDIEEIKTIENNYLQRIQSLQTKTAEIDGLKATLENHSNSLTELESQYNNLSERVAQNEEDIKYLKNKVNEGDSVPTNGIIIYDGKELPEGYVETDIGQLIVVKDRTRIDKVGIGVTLNENINISSNVFSEEGNI